MIDFEKHFRMYCVESSLPIKLSFNMPEGYETANGTFDPTVKTLFINKEMLQSQPEYEQMFYLFHELRHALQYLHPERFDELISRSRFYVIQYDGTCYKLVDGEWKECKLDGSTEHFTELYLGQPYERDANDFAYEKVKELLGDSPELQELHVFWTPKKPIADQAYEELYRLIDEMAGRSKEDKPVEIRLLPVDERNRMELELLQVLPSQEPFIANNSASLQTAEENPLVARPYGIYAGRKPVGFVMLAIDEQNEDPDDKYWIWRFMIDKGEQGKGYASAALREILVLFRRMDADPITLSTKPENTVALRLYHRFGFLENGQQNGDEIVLKLRFSQQQI